MKSRKSNLEWKKRQKVKSVRTPLPHCRTRTQRPHSLLHALSFHHVAYLYLLWDETGYFKINHQVDDPSRSWVWVPQSLAPFTMSQKMSCHTIASQILVASWHSFESSEQRGDLHVFCFILIKEIQLWQNRFRDLYLNVSQQREERPFSLKLFKLNQPCVDGSSPTRTESRQLALSNFSSLGVLMSQRKPENGVTTGEQHIH